ncbi:glutaredoxin family protein [Paenarthrobacter ureafaciens]|uniref:glutaredoxin family protein n=1 Tax=Paenarthrobacter ureafaciens TaxID=37931 RepID=UPI001917813C|nr:glutaredoxin family protein [Paenarthrobacter ureafaciens]QQQ64325.1 glutaredoxin family protein [Paenarthrobacter ureafaciens]
MTTSSTDYTVYIKPECPNCERTREYFDSKGITYTAVDVTEVPTALEYITDELGYTQAPVVVNNSDDQDHWSGLRRDKLVHAAMTHTAA